MKRTDTNRYPNAATLFKFCKAALELRYDGNIKVIDQDVGAILGYDPADCSHWKKGKKNIRALETVRSIADHLKIDERLLIDIASGRVDLHEALFEYQGYGAFNLEGPTLDALKKEYFKNPKKWGDGPNLRSFEEIFNLRRSDVVNLANKILEEGNFKEAPVYIPEIFSLFESTKFTKDENIEASYICEIFESDDKWNLNFRYKGPSIRPYIRFIAATELYKFLIKSKNELCSKLWDSPEEVIEIQSRIFASLTLIPDHLLRQEVDSINSSLDIISQLATSFWASKTLINKRMYDFIDLK